MLQACYGGLPRVPQPSAASYSASGAQQRGAELDPGLVAQGRSGDGGAEIAVFAWFLSQPTNSIVFSY